MKRVTRKILSMVLVVVLFMAVLPAPTLQAESDVGLRVFVPPNEIRVEINGIYVRFPDQGPVSVNGRTLVPVRGVFEQLDFTVQWERDTRRVVLTREADTVIITENSTSFSVNGVAHPLDVPAQEIGGRMMIPFRIVLESVGYLVQWDSGANTIRISSRPNCPEPYAPYPVDNGIPNVPTNAVEAVADFAEEFFRQVLLAPSVADTNLVISPLSAYFALAMVAQGAGGNTLYEFSQLFRYDSFELAAELGAFAADLMDTSGSTELTVAGSVWVRDDFTAHSEFARRMAEYFASEVFSRDFAANATLDEINNWIYEQTHGLISDAIEEIPADIMMYLVNTLYFYAKWAANFRPLDETTRRFTPEGGSPAWVDFLTVGGSSGTTLRVYISSEREAALIPYDCGRFGFLLARPVDGRTVRELADSITIANIFTSLAPRYGVQLHMPEIDKDFKFCLIDTLMTMGLVDAFSPIASDLDALVESLLGYTGLYISSADQIVRIMVDSEGTEAAAVTIIGVAPESIPEPPSTMLDFNTPYIYAIVCLQTGVPLFIGIVDDPSAF